MQSTGGGILLENRRGGGIKLLFGRGYSMTESIKESLATLIDSWIDEKSLRTIAALARQSGVSESVVRRAHRKEAIPNVDNLAKILMTTTYTKTFKELKAAIPAVLSEYLISKDYIFANSGFDGERTTLEIESHLQTFENYLVFKRISHSDMIYRSDIKDQYGFRGLKALDELIDVGLVEQSDREVLSIALKNFSTSHDLQKRHLPKLVETFYDFEDSRHILANYSESITSKAAREILELQKETNKKIANIMINNPGDVPYLYMGLLNPMDFRVGEDV